MLSVRWLDLCHVASVIFFFLRQEWHLEHVFVLGSNRSSILFRYAMEDLLRALAILILLRCGNGFLLPKIQHSWFLKTETAKNRHKRLDCQTLQFFHVQIHCACQWIMTLPPKILWPTALLNTWNIIHFQNRHFITQITRSHKYKCMNDGFLINQHADQKNFVRAEHNSM